MAVISKVLSRTAAATTSTTLYTTTAGSTAIVTNILATNTASSAGTFTINFNSVAAFSGVNINGNETVSIDLKQVLSSGQTITGLASTTAINFHVSGVEVA